MDASTADSAGVRRSGLVHEVEPADPRVIDAVSGALSGQCAGDVVDEADGDITLAESLFPAPTAS